MDLNQTNKKTSVDKSCMTELEQICALPINLAIKLTAGNELSHSGNANLMIIAEVPNNNFQLNSESECHKELSINSKLGPFFKKKKPNSDEPNKNIEISINSAKASKPPPVTVEEPYVREQWSRKTEFLLAIIGFSVDLGNIWRFPKVVYENGGGRFLVPYFVQLALCGLPLFYMELALGQFHQTGIFTLWEKICPILKGIAFTVMLINLFMAMFYNTVISWAVYYLLLSFKSVLPWKGCDNEWNTACCYPINDNNKISRVNNFTYDEINYQKISNNGLIFRRQKTLDNYRLAIFDTHYTKDYKKNISQIFDGVSSYFSSINISFPSLNRLDKNLSDLGADMSHFKITKMINSYFVLYNNELIPLELPKNFISQDNLNTYIHDPEALSSDIERLISNAYKNKSIEIVLNCAELMNNPTQEFYTRYLTEMHLSTGIDNLGSIKWELVGCLLLVFISVYFALWKGIKSAGKAVWITATAPYIVLFILLIRGFTLEGSSIGIKFYLTVTDWCSLAEMKVWIDAAAQIFFSLGPGFGTIIALSSYNKKTNNIYKDAILTSFINCFTSILSGFVVFSTLGHMAHVQGKTIQEVTEPGPGLIFITYPQAISMMPGAPFWAVLFFFMLFTLGIDSTFGGLESIITAICDNFPTTVGKKRPQFVFVLLLVCFLGALPTATYGGPYIVHLFDSYTVAPSILFVAFLEVIAVMYAYGCDRFCDDINQMINSRPSQFWIICWKYIAPFLVMLMTIMICNAMLTYPLTFGDEYAYDGLGNILAVLIVCVPLTFIPIYAIYRIYVTKGKNLKERIIKIIKPAKAIKELSDHVDLDLNTIDQSNTMVYLKDNVANVALSGIDSSNQL